MPWLIGGGVLLALMLSSKRAAAPAYVAPTSTSHPVARAVPAWRLAHANSLYSWVNYFTGSNYSSKNTTPVPSSAYAAMVATACAHASPSDIPLLSALVNDLQVVIGIRPMQAGGIGGIEGMTPSQATNYRNQVLSTIARLQGSAHVAVPRRGPTTVPIGVTPHPSGGGGGYNMYSSQGGAPSGGGGGFPSMPSIPGGHGGGAEGTGQPAPTPTDPSTGLPYNVAPPVDNSQLPYADNSGSSNPPIGSTDSSGVTWGGELP